MKLRRLKRALEDFLERGVGRVLSCVTNPRSVLADCGNGG